MNRMMTILLLATVMVGMVHAEDQPDEFLPGETCEQALKRGPRRLSALPTDWVKGGVICGAAEISASQPPTTFICDCGSSGTSCSASYIKQSVLHMALCPTQAYNTTTCHVVDTTIAGTRKTFAEANLSAGPGNTYAAFTDGIGVGDANAGGYIGTASYLALTGQIQYNHNDFVTSDPAGTTTVASLCVVPHSGSTATSFGQCGPVRTATPGTYKFSLYGYTWGANYAAATAGANYLIGRTKVCAHGATQVKVNGVVNGVGVVGTTTQVTTVSMTQADGVELTYGFPQSYMHGATSSCTANSDTKFGLNNVVECTPTGVRTVKITAVSADCGGGVPGVYIDYGFDMTDLNTANKWFAYDPSVDTSRTGTSGTTTGGAATTGATTAGTTSGAGTTTGGAATTGATTAGTTSGAGGSTTSGSGNSTTGGGNTTTGTATSSSAAAAAASAAAATTDTEGTTSNAVNAVMSLGAMFAMALGAQWA